MFGILGMYGIMPFACSSSAVQTFRDVQISHSARWATHDVIGETPVNEYIGRFILVGFNEDRRHFSGTGAPVSMDVDLSLEEDRAFSLIGTLTSLL